MEKKDDDDLHQMILHRTEWMKKWLSLFCSFNTSSLTGLTGFLSSVGGVFLNAMVNQFDLVGFKRS